MKKILITGAGGMMGRALVDGLTPLNKYEIIATSRTPKPDRNVIKLDVRDKDECIRLFKGVDTVIHAAFYMDNNYKDAFVDEQIPANYIGGFNVYEAARINGVKRVIFCSSNHAVGFYKVTDVIDEMSPVRPDSFYGLAKCFNETLGQYYSDRFGISSINVRIGHLRDQDRPWSIRTSKIFLSRRDCAQLFEKAIDAGPEVKYAVVFGISNNTGKYWSLDHAKEVLGYEPVDDGYDRLDWEHLEETVDNTEYMGGAFVSDVTT